MKEDKFILYAISNYGVKFTPEQAHVFRTKFFQEYNGLAAWHERALRKGKSERKVYSPLGRLRHLDESAHNEILNHPVQAAGADGLKTALRNVYRRAKKYGSDVRLVHHVHDEIIAQVTDDPELLELWQKEQKAGMEDALRDVLAPVPAEADPGVGATWADK